MAPLDSVLDIDGNRHVLDRLRALTESRRAIAFVGAGASAGLYPLWPELVRLLIGEAAKRGLATDADRATWERLAEARPQQVVRGVREHLGPQVYGAVLRELFGLRSDPPHTEVHGLLVRLPFRGHVTTNYDPGLLEARRLLRPDVPATGYATWRDHDALRAWHTGEAFGDRACPVLYAHGVFERSDTIVLGAGEYREAYRPGPFRELVRALWSREHLVFVGFGFNDAWFDTVAEEALGLTREGAGEPRHIAIVGLPEGEPYSRELRTTFRDAYDAEVLLYPVVGGDHSALAAVLAELAGPPPAPPPPPPAPTPARPVERWMHETTEDERYTEPAGVLERLDRWAADPRARVIAVTGIGGLGKTALVGHWLKGRGVGRPVRGLFGWSFNANRSVPECLRGLSEFAGRPGADAVAALRGVPLVVVLDALEVLQEPPGDPAAGGAWLEHGQFLDDDLRTFLDAACRLDHGGLVVLTSRFPFADLTGELGGAVRLLELERLTPGEGARLLARLDVGGSDAEREAISGRLEGHPLALRVFAAALLRQAKSDPSRLLEVPFAAGHLRADDPLEAKVRELLGFYERQLPPAWRGLLGVVALFPDEVGLASITELGRNLPGVREHLAEITDGALRGALAALAGDGLLTRERGPDGEEWYACHPVVRAHFRSALLGQGADVATTAAGLLAGQGHGVVKTREELATVTNAIAVLLEADQVERADALYVERLAQGRAFKWLPAMQEGVRCALGFVSDERRRLLVREQLSPAGLSDHVNDVGLAALNAGEFELADRYLREGVDLDARAGDDQNLAIALLNLGELLINRGRLAEAGAVLGDSLTLARRVGPGMSLRSSLAYVGWVLGLQGATSLAIASFREAEQTERRSEPDNDALYSGRGVRWAEFLLRLGRVAEARRVTERNLEICTHNRWYEDVARCHHVLGRLDALANRHRPAAGHLADAATTFRAGHMLCDLTDVLLAQADLHRRRRAWPEAESHLAEALRIAASRGMRLRHADALVLRGRIRLERQETALAAAEALDDAGAALTLARACGYAWAELDALRLMADALAAQGDPNGARAARRDAEALARRLVPPDLDLGP